MSVVHRRQLDTNSSRTASLRAARPPIHLESKPNIPCSLSMCFFGGEGHVCFDLYYLFVNSKLLFLFSLGHVICAKMEKSFIGTDCLFINTTLSAAIPLT